MLRQLKTPMGTKRLSPVFYTGRQTRLEWFVAVSKKFDTNPGQWRSTAGLGFSI